METMISFLIGKDQNIEKNSILWNMISSIVYSFQSAVLLLIVTRIGGLAAAGLFSITYSVSQMFLSIGHFSMREYHVSDVKNLYSFDTYLTSRCLTVAVMLLACVGYTILEGYSAEKILTISILSLYRAVDSFDDLFHGYLQKNGRLDIASRIFTCRILLASILFILTFAITGSILTASAVMTITAIVSASIMNLAIAGRMSITGNIAFRGMWKLMWTCTPLCVGAFLYDYLVNSPKYAIEALMNEEMQGVFNILYMPVFVSAMLSTFIFKPFVFRLGQLFTEGQRKKMIRLSLILAGLIAAASLCVLLGGAVLGIPVLDLVFGVDLREYHSIFLLLLMAGGLAALNSFGSTLITVMRKQIFIFVAYIAALGVNLLTVRPMVTARGLTGAGLSFALSMGIILLIYCAVITWSFIKLKNDDRME